MNPVSIRTFDFFIFFSRVFQQHHALDKHNYNSHPVLCTACCIQYYIIIFLMGRYFESFHPLLIRYHSNTIVVSLRRIQIRRIRKPTCPLFLIPSLYTTILLSAYTLDMPQRRRRCITSRWSLLRSCPVGCSICITRIRCITVTINGCEDVGGCHCGREKVWSSPFLHGCIS